jgi:hypothetical protein
MNASKNQICETHTQKEESSNKEKPEVKKMETPNPDKSTGKTKETEQHNTRDLLNPMSGYVQHTTHLDPNAVKTATSLASY